MSSSIERVGVVGAGQMGSGIAEVAAKAGADVVVFEPTEALLGAGRDRITGSLERAASRGKLSEADRDATLARFSFTTNLADLSDRQLVIEAVVEDETVKGKIFAQLDEPTAALSQHEILEFYHIVERLKQDGKAILFISHKFDEIFELADYYTILRDGVYVSSGAINDITEERMVAMMVGRAITQTYPKVDCIPGETVLEVKDLCHPTEFAHISFSLRKGEILGFYGLVGAGRTELMQALSGVSRPSSGEIRLNGRTMRFHQPADAIRAGIVCVPEERQKQGAIIALPIAQNISLPQLSKLNPNGVLNDAREWRLADEYASRLQVKAFSWRQPVETLSGGNQQKVVIGKWLATQPEVIILDEPTKGIDIGSKAAVHQFMSELVSQGLAVIMVSSELPEILGMSDRVMVMHEGRITGILEKDEADQETILSLASH